MYMYMQLHILPLNMYPLFCKFYVPLNVQPLAVQWKTYNVNIFCHKITYTGTLALLIKFHCLFCLYELTQFCELNLSAVTNKNNLKFCRQLQQHELYVCENFVNNLVCDLAELSVLVAYFCHNLAHLNMGLAIYCYISRGGSRNSGNHRVEHDKKKCLTFFPLRMCK